MFGAVQLDIDKINNTATLCQLYVDPNFRKQNISDKLVISLLNKLKKQKIKKVHLFVSKNQTGAIKLYKRCGFKIIGKDSMRLGDNLIHQGLIMDKKI